LGFDPLDPAVLYLGTEAGLFRSADSGETFVPVLDHGYITDIEIARSDPAVGYAAHHSRHDVAWCTGRPTGGGVGGESAAPPSRAGSTSSS